MGKKVFILMGILVIIMACSHRVDVALRPDFSKEIQTGNALSTITPALMFFKGNFADRRPDPSKLASFKQGPHSYTLFEERPLEDAIFEGLRAVVTASNQLWDVSAGDVKVNVIFINLQASRNAGLFEVGAVSSMQIQAEFVNAKTGELIYSNVYSGNDERSKAMIGLMGMVKNSIDASVVNCLQSIGDDAELAKALEKIRF